jgi:hypothetical protein
MLTRESCGLHVLHRYRGVVFHPPPASERQANEHIFQCQIHAPPRLLNEVQGFRDLTSV